MAGTGVVIRNDKALGHRVRVTDSADTNQEDQVKLESEHKQQHRGKP
jgi:hypothetical protein